MERFDAAIIGAGPEGLVAAAMLGRAGFKTVVLEKAAAAGGRATSLEFHPGFTASPFADELAPISDSLFRALDLARLGAVLAPSPASVLLSSTGTNVVIGADGAKHASREGAELGAFRRELNGLRAAIAARAAEAALPRPRFTFFGGVPASTPWPGEELGRSSMDEFLRMRISSAELRLHMAAVALSGRAASPFLAGTALHLLAPGAGLSGVAAGGLTTLGRALEKAARAAGAEIRCAAEVTDVKLAKGRVLSLGLAQGGPVEARAVLSALDVKRTILGLISWNDLPQPLVKRTGQFRIAGQRARVLFALDGRPDFAFAPRARLELSDAALGPIHVADSLEAISLGYDSWRSGVIPEMPLVTLRVPSALDPSLAPAGQALLTATLSPIPSKLFDGGWTDAKRERIAALALAAAERAAPGISKRVLATRVIVAPDVEAALGLTEGDLDGGELAPDQALSFRPFADWPSGRTPVKGLYLAGPSSAPAPMLTGASGARAAAAVIADLNAGRLS